MERLFEVGQPRVRAAEDRDALERHVGGANRLDNGARLVLGRRERAHGRLRPVGARRAQGLLRAAEVRHEPVREHEHLRRRAVVLLEPYNGRVREAARHAEQVLRPGAGERVDRLVVVADDAEIVSVAEPEVEERLLEKVDVLVLVDGERAVLRAERRGGALVLLEQPNRRLEQILEVHEPLLVLAALVVAVDARHEVVRDRRLAVGGRGEVLVGRDAPVLRPLDLGREIARGPELERTWQPVADVPQRQRFRREDLADRAGREMTQLAERRGVERPRAHALDA